MEMRGHIQSARSAVRAGWAEAGRMQQIGIEYQYFASEA